MNINHFIINHTELISESLDDFLLCPELPTHLKPEVGTFRNMLIALSALLHHTSIASVLGNGNHLPLNDAHSVSATTGVVSGSLWWDSEVELLYNFTKHLSGPCLQLFESDQKEFYRVCIIWRGSFKEYLFAFLLDTVLIGVLIVVGLIGNVLSIVVLSHDRSQYPGANTLLKALCFADSVFLCVCFFYLSLRHVYPITGFLEGYHDIFPFLVGYLWPLAMAVQHVINWLIVLVSLERYNVVCQPLLVGNQWGSASRARHLALVLTLLVAIFNIPRLYEWHVVQVRVPCLNYTHYQATDSDLRRDPWYTFGYRLALYALLVAVGPIVLLCYVNYQLIVALREASIDRMELTVSSPTHPRHPLLGAAVTETALMPAPLMDTGAETLPHHPTPYSAYAFLTRHNPGYVTPLHQNQLPRSPADTPRRLNVIRDRNRSITKIIIVTVLIFIACEIPALVHQVLAAAHVPMNPVWEFYSVGISNALVVIKSASNFLIYCACGRKFRFILQRVICKRTRNSTARVPHSLVAILQRLRTRLQQPEMRSSRAEQAGQVIANQYRRACVDLGDMNL